MQVGAGVGMAPRDILVELDAEAGLARRDHVAGFPADGLLEQPRVEAVPGLDALENQEIRAAGTNLDVRRALDRSAIEMRRDLRIMRFRHARDLLGLEHPADTSERHLQDRCSL